MRKLIAGITILKIVYYILLSIAWMLLDWNAFFLGWVAAIVACIINPLLCAYVASQVTSVQKTISSVVIWLILLCVVLVSPTLSNVIWLHASGYYSHAISNHDDFLGETIAVNQFLNVIGMLIGGIVFTVSFAIWRPRHEGREELTMDSIVCQPGWECR